MENAASSRSESETPQRFERCRYRPCPDPAMPGAFVIPLAEPVGGRRWGYFCLCMPHGALAVSKGARYIDWRPKPGERALGVVEHELRARWGEGGNREVMTATTHRVWAGARAELRRRGHLRPSSAEIASEAIEAAEALGL